MKVLGINPASISKPVFRSNQCECKNTNPTQAENIDYSIYFPSDGDMLVESMPNPDLKPYIPQVINDANHFDQYKDGMVATD